MTIDPWLGLAGLGLTVLGAMLKHVISDARNYQRLKNLEQRVKKLDGIDANGH